MAARAKSSDLAANAVAGDAEEQQACTTTHMTETSRWKDNASSMKFTSAFLPASVPLVLASLLCMRPRTHLGVWVVQVLPGAGVSRFVPIDAAVGLCVQLLPQSLCQWRRSERAPPPIDEAHGQIYLQVHMPHWHARDGMTIAAAYE